MKKLILFLLLIFNYTIIMAQTQFDYKSAWENIEKQEEKGLGKSMLNQVNTIFRQAKKDQNSQQLIRALLYQSRILQETADNEDIQLEIVNNFKNEINSAKGVEKQILESILGELYADYYNENRWEIENLTELEESAGENFRTWTENQFRDEIIKLYKNSLENPGKLKAEPIENWVYLLKREKETEKFRPTLYDFLAYRALDFLAGENDYFSRPKFDSEYEAEKKEFITSVYSDLIQFHKSKGNQDALAYSELEFLNYKKQNLTDEAYEEKLINLSKSYSDNSYSPYILMELAKFYQKQVDSRDENDYSSRKELTEKSISWLDKIITKFPKSDLSKDAQRFKNRFNADRLTIQIENYISPNRNTPIKITHRNLDKVYFKILKYDEKTIENYSNFRNTEKNKKQNLLNALIRNAQIIDEYSVDLKAFDDYQDHTTLIKLNPLPAGRYLVFAGNNSDFKINDDFTLNNSIVNVTNYAIDTRGMEVLVTERESGKPAAYKNVEIFQYKDGKDRKIQTVKTDENGLGVITSLTSGRNSTYKIEGEEVEYSSYFYNYFGEEPKNTKTMVRFFTDRGIYRPGQIVHFKIIAYNEFQDQAKKVIPNKNINIKLLDPNNKISSEIKVTTNEFGSASGEFVLPSGGLTGNYSLSVKQGEFYNSSDYSFSVEEYKRPKFEVEFDKVDDIFKLNEEITAKGKATAFSGANIDNADVVYRVYRQAVYPYRPWWMKNIYPQFEPQEEITHGETKTDSDGKFEIKFNAISPNSTKAKENSFPLGRPGGDVRTYIYKITADITDINGETHSSEQSITVGDLRYMLDFPVAERIEISKLDSIPVSTKNLNGQFAAAKGKISLTKINPPERVLRNSPLRGMDYELYSKQDFVSYFPNEAYGGENEKQNWEKDSPVLEENFNTKISESLKINPKNWKEGYYILKGYIMDGKDTIPSEKLIYLYKNEKKNPVDNELFAIQTDKESYKPGETAKITISSASPDSEILIQLEANGEIVKTDRIQINNSVETYLIPIKEEYRGDVFVHYYFGKFNTAMPGKLTINVPYEDTSLKITTSTLRDKLQPGQNEIWELTVSGNNKDKFLAEMLATMYDKSLDQFRSRTISFQTGKSANYSKFNSWDTYKARGLSYSGSLFSNSDLNFYPNFYMSFDKLNWFGFNFGRYLQELSYMLGGEVAGIVLESSDYGGYAIAEQMPAPESESKAVIRGNNSMDIAKQKALYVVDGVFVEGGDIDPDLISSVSVLKDSAATAIYGARGANGVVIITTKKAEQQLNQVQARKNLQETAFFYPNLRTDENGNVKIQFTTPESLTSWKFMAMAHTPDLRTGYFETTVQTQKDLMVVPNPPRFLREGDTITFSSKLTNLSDNELTGQAKLMLFDAFSMQPVDNEFENQNAVRNFKVSKGQSDNISWTLKVPKGLGAVVYRVAASAGDFSDGEESALPILTNRMLVTETLPISVREGQTKTYSFDKLKNNPSSTLDNFKLTFEMTTNPIWIAIFSLPYLREYPYECSEQVFARLYGNLISQHIINSNPKIKNVFDDWNLKGELKSKLEQNEELKSILLEETPWVREAESEEEQMKRIAVLFDLNQMSNELTNTFEKLKNKQSTNGGFPWFEGGSESFYITAHIISGFGHLQKMKIDLNQKANANPDSMIQNAIRFIDSEMEKTWDKYQKNKDFKPSNYTGIQYLYARSYFLNQYPLSQKGKVIRDYFLKELEKDKFKQPLQTQAMLAMIFNRYNKKSSAKELLTSVKDNSVESDEMGMYWKNNQPGWFWYEAPVETQAMLIEAFDEITEDVEVVEAMKVWLLKNRQANQWNSTKATTEAVYVLMNTGKDWTSAEDGITVKIGNQNLDLKALEKAPQSGSGYVKTSWHKSEIKPEMGEIEVQKTSPGVSWGAMYWQYFEDLDKITDANTSVKFKKELFLKKNTDKGSVLRKITEETPIEIGDLVTVRLEIQTDRDMEFVHIKDMRASGFEPVNVISKYKWQGGLGYYESTRDAATNFFIDRMPKGTYVFEYDVRANNAGNFSNGITSLQNMYAPELSAHSEGIRIEIK
ncbi:MAG: MG2 domain-containing protein [Weeksellaceae bacterium]